MAPITGMASKGLSEERQIVASLACVLRNLGAIESEGVMWLLGV